MRRHRHAQGSGPDAGSRVANDTVVANPLERLGAVVLGLSPDAPKRTQAFDAKHDLGFPLLSDEDHAVAEAYGTWVEKSMYGKKFMGVQRSTFVIDPEGRVAHVIPKVQPKVHDEQVLAALEELGAAA